MTERRPLAIDLFAGAGGLSEGLHLAGWDVAVAVERDRFAAGTYELNQNERQHRNTKMIQGDIKEVTRAVLAQALEEARGLSLEDVDLIAGGPPCQGFSTIGPRSLTDPRNRLFLDFIRIVHAVRPKVFLAENVRGVLSFAKMKTFLFKTFSRLGYNLSYQVVNTQDFGVPQDRARVIFMGVRRDVATQLGLEIFHAPAPCMPDVLRNAYPDGHTVTFGEALSDLPLGRAVALKSRIWVTDGALHPEDQQNEPYPYPADRIVTQYQAAMRRDTIGVHDSHTKGMSEERLARVSQIPEGGRFGTVNRSNAWRRLSWNRPAHTIQAHMGKDLKEFIHPTVHRWITVREAARLQSFDDAYKFLGAQGPQLCQVGNAVAPFMGWAVGRAVGEQLGVLTPTHCPLREPRLEQQEALFSQASNEMRLFNALECLGRSPSKARWTARLIEGIYDMMIKEAQDVAARKLEQKATAKSQQEAEVAARSIINVDPTVNNA